MYMYNADGSATVPGLIKHKALLSINTPLRKPKQHHCSQASVTYISADTRTRDTKRRTNGKSSIGRTAASTPGTGNRHDTCHEHTGHVFSNCDLSILTEHIAKIGLQRPQRRRRGTIPEKVIYLDDLYHSLEP